MHDHRLADMAGGNGVSASTIGRWTWEIIGLLAARGGAVDTCISAAATWPLSYQGIRRPGRPASRRACLPDAASTDRE
jgi:hypothetical protein